MIGGLPPACPWATLVAATGFSPVGSCTTSRRLLIALLAGLSKTGLMAVADRRIYYVT